MKQLLLRQGVDERAAEELVLHDLVLVPDVELDQAKRQGSYED